MLELLINGAIVLTLILVTAACPTDRSTRWADD